MSDVPVAFESKQLELVWIDAKNYENTLASSYLTVSPISGRSTMIKFTMLPFTSGSTFYLQKSTSVTSGWKTIAVLTMLDVSYLDDDANNTMNRHDIENYRVVSVLNSKVVGIARSEGYIDAYGAEIARRHRIQLVNGNAGNRTYIFNKMRNDVRCPDCWDEILQKRSRINCEPCKSTGFLGGYYNPIEVYISFGAESIAIDQGISGPSSVSNSLQAWTSNYPLFNIGDVICEATSGRFWSVKQSNITMYKRVVTKQELILDREDGDDPLLELINRIPSDSSEGGLAYGKSIFQDDSENSAGISYSSSSEILH